MNVFVLDYDPRTAAQWHVDAHVVKMILESVQILSTVIQMDPDTRCSQPSLYHPTHRNHPCTLWASRSLSNWRWLKSLTCELNREFKYRFSGRDHASFVRMQVFPEPSILDLGLTPFAWAFGQYKESIKSLVPDDVVEAYRYYYVMAKQPLAKWTKRRPPPWWEPMSHIVENISHANV